MKEPVVYTVYGGYPEEEADHWATFRSLAYARAYKEEQLRIAPRPGLDLGICEDKPGPGETYADGEWEAQFSPLCTSGCREGFGLCGLCQPVFCSEGPPSS